MKENPIIAFFARRLEYCCFGDTFRCPGGDPADRSAPSDISKSVVDVTIDTAAVDTRVEQRDNHVRSPGFLDVAKHPTLTFKSKRVESAGQGKLKVTGDLTIHGTTKPVVLDVNGPSDPIKDPRGGLHMGVSATTTIDRQTLV